MFRRTAHGWIKHVDFIVLDIFCLFLSLIFAYWFRHVSDSAMLKHAEYRLLTIWLLSLDILVSVSFNSMKSVLKRGYLIEMGYTLRNAAMVYSLGALLLFMIKSGSTYSRIMYFVSCAAYILLGYCTRILYKKVLKKYILPQSGNSLLFISDGNHLDELKKNIEKGAFSAFRIAGIALTCGIDAAGISMPETVPVVAQNDEIESWVLRNWVDEVLILAPASEELVSMARAFMEMGITVNIGMNYLLDFNSEGHRTLGRMGGYNVLTSYWTSADVLHTSIKRAFDILGGMAGCLITLALFIILGPIIYISSPGPVFFKQKRIGRNGKIFEMYKFRSMYPDADERKKEYRKQNRSKDGLMFKLDWDPRIIGNRILPDGRKKTGIGDFIRRTSLDEFPQFFNVLKGDMSMVGTRPPTLDEWDKYQEHHRARMAMRPGITGLWQVSGRSKITDFEEIVRLDTKYISDWSLALDLKILLKTIPVVFKREGSM